MQSKHFLAGLLFVIVAGFIALLASVFLILVSTFSNYHAVDDQRYDKIFIFRSKQHRSPLQVNNETRLNEIRVKSQHFTKLNSQRQCGSVNEVSTSAEMTSGASPKFARIIGGREVLPNNYPWVNMQYLFILDLQ